jgi:hypothetical protein
METTMGTRKILITSLLIVVVLGHAVDIVIRHENWPFSYYPMFARLNERRECTLLAVVGIAAPDGKEVLLMDPGYSDPLPPLHLRVALDMANRLSSGRQQALVALSREYLQRYQANRARGLHHGPDLLGLRVYQLDWDHLDPWARDAMSPTREQILFDSRTPQSPAVEVPRHWKSLVEGL